MTRKIVNSACRIAKESQEKLHLGNISIARDWGWAPEYVEAMWLMLQQDQPDDYLIATGESNTLENFVAEALQLFPLDWREHVFSAPSLPRPLEIMKPGQPGEGGKRSRLAGRQSDARGSFPHGSG